MHCKLKTQGDVPGGLSQALIGGSRLDAPGPGSFTAAATTVLEEGSFFDRARGGRRAGGPIAARRRHKPKPRPRTAYGTGSAPASATGTTTLAIKPRHAALDALRSLGLLPVRIAVTYTPSGGTPKTKSKALTVNGAVAHRR